jgi:hypothetical protein
LIGKMATVAFQGKTARGVPRFPVVKLANRGKSKREFI